MTGAPAGTTSTARACAFGRERAKEAIRDSKAEAEAPAGAETVTGFTQTRQPLLGRRVGSGAARRKGWGIVALDLGLDTSTPRHLDTSTPSGEMMASVLAVFSQFERRLIGERARVALAELRAQGATLGRPREMSTAAVERIRELRDAGMTLTAIADELNRSGIPTPTGRGRWHQAGVARALRFAEAA